MKRFTKILACLLTLACLTAAFAACTSDTPDDGVPTDPFGLTLSVKDVTPTGLTLVFTQSGGTPTGQLQTAAAFRIDQGVYDSFRHLNTILEEDEQYQWPAATYDIPTDGTLEMVLDWTDLYGELSAGTYRIAKGISDVRGEGDSDAFTYFVTFEITE